MRTREEAARYVEGQFESYDATPLPAYMGPKNAWHYGRQDVRALLDYIYGGLPADAERVRGWRSLQANVRRK